MATLQMARSGVFTSRASAPRAVVRAVVPVAPRSAQTSSFLGGKQLRPTLQIRGHRATPHDACPARCAEATLVAPSSGMKWTMMRHGNRVKHLGRPADQRKALIRSLVTEVIRHGAIRTTKVNRIVVRKWEELRMDQSACLHGSWSLSICGFGPPSRRSRPW